MRHVEVDKQSELMPGQSQVRQQLRPMHRQNDFHTLDLNDQAFFDDEIDDVGRREFISFISDRQPDLVLKVQAPPGELITKARVVCALENYRRQAQYELSSQRQLFRRKDHSSSASLLF